MSICVLFRARKAVTARKILADLNLIKRELLRQFVNELLSRLLHLLDLVCAQVVCPHRFIRKHLPLSVQHIWWCCLGTEHDGTTGDVLEAVARYYSLITAVNHAVRLLILMMLLLQNQVFYHWYELSPVQAFVRFLHLILRPFILLVELDRGVHVLLQLD
jgi:hypothetical protein